MAGAVMTFTYERSGPLVKVIADWTSDSATGAVSDTCAKVSGRLIKAVTNPGSAAPTADYDIAITDGESLNVLTICEDDLADRHTTATEEVYFLVLNLASTDPTGTVHPVVCDPLTIAVTSAGNSKTGRVILYVEGIHFA